MLFDSRFFVVEPDAPSNPLPAPPPMAPVLFPGPAERRRYALLQAAAGLYPYIAEMCDLERQDMLAACVQEAEALLAEIERGEKAAKGGPK